MNQRNNAIDILRFLCAVMVIAIHTRPVLWLQNYLDGGIQIFVQIAVPFFFCITGYFLKEGENKLGTSAILHVLKKDFFLYLIWSIVYFAVIFMQNPTLISLHSIKWVMMDFFVNGSFYHLWYMVAVMWCLLLMYVLCKLELKKIFEGGGTFVLYLLGLSGTSYYLLGNQLPILSNLINSVYFTILRRICLMGLPFIVLGWMIAEEKERIANITIERTVRTLIVIAGAYITEIAAVVLTGVARSVVITVFLYPLVAILFILCLKCPLIRYKKLGRYCGSMSGIIYFIHPLVVLLLMKVEVTDGKLLFVLTTLSCLVISSVTVWLHQNMMYLKRGNQSHEK